MKERIDDLEINNLKIIQNEDYFCFTIDSVLLSDFGKKIKANSTVLDIGTGNGVIPLLLSAKTNSNKIFGIEIQKELYELAIRNIEMNNLQELISIINDDINNIENYFSKNYFDAIITNPPYKKHNTGLINDNKYISIARHEIHCTLEGILSKSKFLLKDGGQFLMVHRPDRLVDILELMRKYNIEPKNIQFVHSNIDTAPNLVLIEGIKGGKPFLKVNKPLYIYDKNGNYTDDIIKIYGKDEKNEKR